MVMSCGVALSRNPDSPSPPGKSLGYTLVIGFRFYVYWDSRCRKARDEVDPLATEVRSTSLKKVHDHAHYRDHGTSLFDTQWSGWNVQHR